MSDLAHHFPCVEAGGGLVSSAWWRGGGGVSLGCRGLGCSWPRQGCSPQGLDLLQFRASQVVQRQPGWPEVSVRLDTVGEGLPSASCPQRTCLWGWGSAQWPQS